MDLIRFILKSRGMCHMTRFQNSPRIRDNNVAEHSYYVALYAHMICGYIDISPETEHGAMRLALLHDIHEGISVEVPNNVKRMLKPEIAAIEAAAIKEIFQGEAWRVENSDPLAAAIVKLADCMDALIYSVEEYKMGNKFFRAVIAEIKYGILDIAEHLDIMYCIRKQSDAPLSLSLVNKLISALGIDDINAMTSDMDNMTHFHKGFDNAII